MKYGNIIVEHCDIKQRNLFPFEVDPTSWKSCNDAYDYTWSSDIHDDLSGLREIDRLRLVKSSGFCPQNRCQLGNVSNADESGFCPAGLCYSKIENGGRSFGTCCFQHGEFKSGHLMGYYNKSQPAPKPIYKHSRVVLGGNIGDSDESYESFVNANMLFPGFIATQCPLTSRPSNFVNTLNDVKKMILEQNITFWVQLAPNIAEVDVGKKFDEILDKLSEGNCGIFPVEFFADPQLALGHDEGVSNFRFNNFDPKGDAISLLRYVNMSYTVSGYYRTDLVSGKRITVLEMPAQTDDAHSAPMAVGNLEKAANLTMVPTESDHPCADVNSNTIDPITAQGLEMSAENLNVIFDVQTAEVELNPSREQPAPVESVAPTLSLKATFAPSLSSAPATGAERQHTRGGSTYQGAAGAGAGMGVKAGVEGWKRVSVNVTHLWFFRWKDFDVPKERDLDTMRDIAVAGADVIGAGGTIAVNCLGGRGRTGTYATMVAKHVYKVKSLSALTEWVVRMREHRDGVVETPSQFRFAARAVGLPDPSVCGSACLAERALRQPLSPAHVLAAFVCGVSLSLLLLWVSRRSSWGWQSGVGLRSKSSKDDIKWVSGEPALGAEGAMGGASGGVYGCRESERKDINSLQMISYHGLLDVEEVDEQGGAGPPRPPSETSPRQRQRRIATASHTY